MIRTLTIDGRVLYRYPNEVETSSLALVVAQAELRWLEYRIPPERCYGWFTDKLRAVIR